MNTTRIFLPLALAGLLAAGPALAREEVTDPKVLEDLVTVLTLQGYGCGKARKAEKLRQNDYEVTCRNGDVYRVRIGDNNRVQITRIR